jgi:protein involved in polysaccharide export with SLBB domain
MTNLTQLARYAALIVLSLTASGCSSGKAINDDVQMRPASARLEPTPVKLAGDESECRVRRVAQQGSVLPASLTALEQAAAVLAKGDTIRIDVADGEEFSGQHTINIDGSISLSYAGTIRAAGLSTNQLRKALETALVKGGFFPGGSVRVGVTPVAWAQIQVAVSGAVFEPGRGYINEFNSEKVSPVVMASAGDGTRMRFIDAGIRSASGVRPDADLTAVQLIRNGKTHVIDLSGVFTGAATPDIALMNGDSINVPSTGCLETGLIRPSVLTPAGIRIFISNLTQPASSNNQSAVGKHATELPYGSRLMDAAISANCVGGAEASNAGRSIVLISKNPMTGREEVIGRDIEAVMAGINDDRTNPYLMPNDAVACYDSAVTNVREVARTVTDILSPFALKKSAF